MVQIASAARQRFTLFSLLRSGWANFFRSADYSATTKGLYGEDIAFTDSVERELNQRELHPYSY